MNKTIEMLSGRRFLSHHIGAEVYYDTGHQVIKTPLLAAATANLSKSCNRMAAIAIKSCLS